MEEALENLTRQHSVPLGYVLPLDAVPAPLSAPVIDAAAPAAASLPRYGEPWIDFLSTVVVVVVCNLTGKRGW